jgi:hypothetical protein
VGQIGGNREPFLLMLTTYSLIFTKFSLNTIGVFGSPAKCVCDDDGCSAMMIRAVVLSCALLIDWHLDVLAFAPPFYAVSAVTQDGLAVCNPVPL